MTFDVIIKSKTSDIKARFNHAEFEKSQSEIKKNMSMIELDDTKPQNRDEITKSAQFCKFRLFPLLIMNIDNTFVIFYFIQ